MDNDSLTTRAIAAGKALLGREIVIQSNADFTPAGGRTARVVSHTMAGRKVAAHIRWYVAGKAYRSLPLSDATVRLTSQWEACTEQSRAALPTMP